MFKQRGGLVEFPARNVDVSRLAEQLVIIRGLDESSAPGRLTAGNFYRKLRRERFAGTRGRTPPARNVRAGQSPEYRRLAAAGPCHAAPSPSGHAPVLKRS